MAVNDLTMPLVPAPRKRQLLIEIPTAQIIAAALGPFLGLFILWAVVADNPSGVGSMAVVPADLHIAKKGPQIIDAPQGVPREPPAADSNGPATTATLPPPPETKLPGNVTVAIVDGKTGLKREVVVAAPERPAAAPMHYGQSSQTISTRPLKRALKAPIDPSDQLAPCQHG